VELATKLAIGAAVGGLIGLVISRVAARKKDSLLSNWLVMTLLGAGLGALVGNSGLPLHALAAGNHLTTVEDFQKKVLQSPRPVVVDFYATWCGPCKRLAPVMDRMEHRFDGRIDFYRVDVDKAPKLAAGHNIQGVPTLLFYHRGEQVDRIVGAPPEMVLKQRFERLLR
jgi:thioredoxin